MDHKQKDYSIGYKRPPKQSQFKKGQSGNPGGRRKKSGPVHVDLESILNETFQVSVAGRVQAMSAKEVEIRQILKRALEKKDFRATAHLLGLFQKRNCFATERVCGVVNLPTSRMPSRMAWLLLEKYGVPENWTKRHIAWGRKQYEETRTELERLCDEAGVMPP
ncbi:hypothetical protein ABIF69_004189 [Bradyrhizobium japonicum]